MDPPPPRRRWVPTSTSSSSVQYVGKYDPLSTADAHRRARSRGNFVDLVTRSSVSTVGERSAQPKKKRAREEEDKFSMPGGKRRQISIQTANIASCCITLEQRWNQGAFRWVHKGQYSQDQRIPWASAQDGQPCVLKEFKTGSVYEDSFFSKDILAVDKAASIIRQFNSYVEGKRISNCNVNGWSGAKTIYLNRPAVWQDIYPDHTGKYKKKLVEPMLEGEFLKFNSNSGYTNGAEFMQALSRFSYHITGGMFLLCDLQGGHYDDCYILTDPVIMSWDNCKIYGSGDLGSEGIENFFAHSTVNKFCDPGWKKPTQIRVSKRIPKAESTSLSLTLGTLQSEKERKQKLVDQFNQQWGTGR